MQLRLLPLLPLALVLLPFGATAHADIVWENNYDQARAKSIATGKPLFVDVFTTWCGWCKKLDTTIYPDPRVQQLAKNFVMLRLNAEAEGASFAKTMNVHSFPTLIFATARGQHERYDGYLEPSDFMEVMMETLRANGPIKPQRTAKTPPRAKGKRATTRQVRPRPQTVASVARTWKSAPELTNKIQSPGYGGAFVLGDGGLVALEGTTKSKKKLTGVKKKTAKFR